MEFRISVTMAVLALAEVVLAIVTAGLCCRAVCCGVNVSKPTRVYYFFLDWRSFCTSVADSLCWNLELSTSFVLSHNKSFILFNTV